MPLDHFFVTSTGTDVGKTLLSGWFLRVLMRQHESVAYYKPVASGCEQGPHGYRSPDETELLDRTSLPEEAVRSSLRFKAPLSPDKAAREEGRSIEMAPLLEDWRALCQRYDRVLVEGIGGVAVPFNPREDVAELIHRMDTPAILVVSSGLGTISHTRTAVAYLRDRGCCLAGIVLTPDRGEPIHALNRDHLREFYPDLPVSLFPWEADFPGETLEDRAASFLGEAGLLEG